MQTGIAQVLDGSSRGLNTASMPADTAQANQGAGKVPKPILASLWNTPARKLGKASSKMVGRHNGVRDQALHSRKQQTARSHSVHKCLGHQRPYRWAPSMKTVQLITSQPPAWQCRWKQLPMLDHLKRWQVRSHKTSSSQWACYKTWNGKPRLLEWIIGPYPPLRPPVGILPWTCQREEKWLSI